MNERKVARKKMEMRPKLTVDLLTENGRTVSKE
jgi:hypothetical protein